MSQSTLPRDTEWLNDTEHHHAAQLLPDLIALCENRGPIDPITRETMIPMQYRERQAKWDEIRRLKAEAEAKEEGEATTPPIHPILSILSIPSIRPIHPIRPIPPTPTRSRPQPGTQHHPRDTNWYGVTV